MNQQRRPKLFDCFYKLLATTLLVRIRKQPPIGPRAIESEIYELSGKLGLFYFDFCMSRSEAKGTASGITWILIANHVEFTSDKKD